MGCRDTDGGGEGGGSACVHLLRWHWIASREINAVSQDRSQLFPKGSLKEMSGKALDY